MTLVEPVNYIHTFSQTEQNRLIHQSKFLESYIYKTLDFSGSTSVLDIGCGVGAQIPIILQHHPHLKITGLDNSKSQLERAHIFLKPLIDTSKVILQQGSAYHLPFNDGSFDTVCIFFVLEHLEKPSLVVQEAFRVLRPGGVIYCTEVFNKGVFVFPECQGIEAYWKAFNQQQADFGGDPNIGIKLGCLFSKVGFINIRLLDVSLLLDGRMNEIEKRQEFLDSIKAAFLSASSTLRSTGKTTDILEKQMIQDFDRLSKDPSSIFLYPVKQLSAEKLGI
jgi:SAM-dependent methyltransferase